MLLKEQSRIINVNATMERNGFNYSVNYTTDNGVLRKLQCDVQGKTQVPIDTPEGVQYSEEQAHLGYMLNESGNKQISLREDTEIAPHLAVFEEILEEVKKGVEAKAK